MTIVLKLVGPYGKEGWQDPEDGVEYFNDVILSPWGPVGNLKVHDNDDDLVIDQAPDAILIGKTFTEGKGSYITTDGFGQKWMDVNARNGNLRYQLLHNVHDDVEWEDKPGETAPFYLALLNYSEWEPEAEYTEELRREIKVVPVEAGE